jgi:hypothetical protein
MRAAGEVDSEGEGKGVGVMGWRWGKIFGLMGRGKMK